MKKENLEKAIKLRHELHEHPELSNQEIWTKNHLIEFLREHTGLEIVDRGRWFYAVYRSEKGNRNIAFRADFDAIAMEEPDTLEYHNMSSMAHGSVNVKDGAINCASSGMTIRMQGQPSHASEPEKGKNPAFAIAKVIDAIPELISTERNSWK